MFLRGLLLCQGLIMVNISLTAILLLAVGSTTYAGALAGKTINQSNVCMLYCWNCIFNLYAKFYQQNLTRTIIFSFNLSSCAFSNTFCIVCFILAFVLFFFIILLTSLWSLLYCSCPKPRTRFPATYAHWVGGKSDCMFVSLILVRIINHRCLSFIIIMSVDTYFDITFVSEYYCRVGQTFIQDKQMNKHFFPQTISYKNDQHILD